MTTRREMEHEREAYLASSVDAQLETIALELDRLASAMTDEATLAEARDAADRVMFYTEWTGLAYDQEPQRGVLVACHRFAGRIRSGWDDFLVSPQLRDWVAGEVADERDLIRALARQAA